MKCFVPTFYEKNIYGISLKSLKQKGIKLLILDIDNTLVPPYTDHPTEDLNSWLFKVAAEGFEVCFVSNSSKKRAETFSGGIYHTVYRANKPFIGGIKKVLKHFRVRPRNACLIGDQIFTDIWCANRAKIMSILVEPMSIDEENSFIRMKRRIEKHLLSKYKPERFALIGNPVFHSKSPEVHNKIYKANGLKGQYTLYEPSVEEIPELIEYFKLAEYVGFNVTIPYKEEIIKYLDHITESAADIGSVNTVYIKNGELYGFNTDGDGFAMQLDANGTRIRGAHIKIIGAGGTTPSIVSSLLKNGAASIAIFNRTLSKAENIARMGDNVTAFPLEDFTADECSILINTTSVGLDSYECPVESIDGLSPEAAVYDVIYSPSVTTFMQRALDRGIKAYNGYGMLQYQALLADRIWFGKDLTI